MSNLFDRMKLLVQRDKEFRSALYDIMGFYPHNVELYRIAFAHKSQEYKSKKTGDRPLNNERLEFLGDAVLETVVSDIVYHHFKNKREGFLTNTRSKIVSRESLGKLAKDLGIDRLIQSHTNSKAHNSFLAGNAFEALMGAIYLDRGFDYAFRFIEHRIMGSVLDLEGVAHKEVNFKSKLLEWSQKNRIHIDFKDKQTSNGSGSTPSFSTTIILEGLFAGDGKGFSKKEAHQNASKDALMRMRREPKFIDDIFSSKEKRTAMEADPCFVLPVIDEIEADLAREAELKEKQAKHEPNKSKKEQPKKEQPKKEQPQKEQPKKEQPKKEQPKAEKPEPKVEATAETVVEAPIKIEPVVVPISMEEIFDEPIAEAKPEPAPAEVSVPAAELAPVEEVAAPAEEATASAEETPAPVADSTPAEVSVPAEETASAAAPAADHTKKPRRRGKRQNAAGFTNTEIIPAETSHRAEKAAKKVEEAKKEKARKIAKKTAKAAAKGIVDEAPAATPAQAPAAESAQQSAEAKPAKAKQNKKSKAPKPQQAAKGNADAASAEAPAEAPAAKPARKPRRKKTKAELPSETPNPERERAIATAEEAAYRQSNNEE